MGNKKKKNLLKSDDMILYQSAKSTELFSLQLFKLISILLVLLLIVFIVLACVIKINEATIAQGEITPEGNIIKVQHFDGGIVSKILTHEGDTVKKGQLLLVLDGIGAREDLDRFKAKNLTLKLQKERLFSIINKREPDYQKYTVDKNKIKEQVHIYHDMLNAIATEQHVIQNQLEQQKLLLSSLQAKKKYFEKEMKIAKDIMQMHEDLSNEGHTSKLKLLEEKRNLIQINKSYEGILYDIKKLAKGVQEYESRLASYDANKLHEYNGKYEKIIDEIKENNELIKKLEKKSSRSSIKSPVTGIIKLQKVNSVSESIYPKTVLYEIVPFTTPLIATLHISPTDVGHVKANDEVHIKVSAYDYIKYGMVKGTLYHISRGTFYDEKNNVYFKGKVRLQHNYVSLAGEKKMLMPGMLLNAQIITGERTIIEYLLKPIFRSIHGGLVER